MQNTEDFIADTTLSVDHQTRDIEFGNGAAVVLEVGTMVQGAEGMLKLQTFVR